MKRTTRQGRFAVLAVGIVASLVLAFAAPSSAERIYKSAPTKVTHSVTQAADGTITVKVFFTSPDPRCLSAKRWKKYSDGYYRAAGGSLSYGEGYGEPPRGGWLFPVTPAGHSPYVWESIWSGAAEVTVDKGSGYFYKSTVAAASGVGLGAGANPFKYKYDQGDDRIILKCRPLFRSFQIQLL